MAAETAKIELSAVDSTTIFMSDEDIRVQE
jgi:hypothetical protein